MQKPTAQEKPISDALMHPENVLMHNKIRKKLIEVVVPLLSGAVEEGVKEGIFSCDNIPERVRMLLVTVICSLSGSIRSLERGDREPPHVSF